MPGIYQITTPAATTQLTTVATANAELGIAGGATDAQVSRLINRASSVIRDWCNNPFGLQTVTETFRFGFVPGQGPASQTVAPYGTPINTQYKPLIVSFAPIVSIVSITENGTALDPNVPDFETDTDAALIYRLRNGNRSWWNPPVVVAVYQSGWSLPNDANPNLPETVEDACLSLVKSAWFATGRDPSVAMDMLNGDRTQFWDRSVTPMAIDDDMAANLASYKFTTF